MDEAIITGKTVLYPLIGWPVAQVRTPPAVNRWFKGASVDAIMFPIEVSPRDVGALMQNMRGWGNCGGLSVTVPHKQTAFRAMDFTTPRATRVGAVNIVRRDANGAFHGDMTDGLAFVHALGNGGFDVVGKTVLIAGAGGGAGAAIADALAEAGAGRLQILEPDATRRIRIMDLLGGRFPAIEITVHDPASPKADLGVNATPLGMSPGDPLPFSLDLISDGGMVADVVTKPNITPLLTEATRRGLRIQAGNDMADSQLAFQLAHLGLALVPAGV